jgi:hypothetical protein
VIIDLTSTTYSSLGRWNLISNDPREIAESCCHFDPKDDPPSEGDDNTIKKKTIINRDHAKVFYDLADMPDCTCSDIVKDSIVDDTIAKRSRADLPLLTILPLDGSAPSDDHFLLMHVQIWGFVLRERQDMWLRVDNVQDLCADNGEEAKVIKKHSGFEDLVLPDGHGELVEALVRSHRSTRKSEEQGSTLQVDLVHGKGEGTTEYLLSHVQF